MSITSANAQIIYKDNFVVKIEGNSDMHFLKCNRLFQFREI